MLYKYEFPSPCHYIIFYIGEATIFPFMWYLNSLASLFMATTREKQEPWKIMFKRILLSPPYLIMLFMCFPLAVIGFILRIVLHLSRHPYILSFKENTSRSSLDVSPSSISIATMNVCLLPEFLSRFNNLSDASKRAAVIGSRIVVDQFHYENMVAAHQEVEARPVLVADHKIRASEDSKAFNHEILTHFPKLDFICLQEAWNRAYTLPLIKELHKVFPWILHSVGSTNYTSNRFLLNSGLMFASRYRILDADFHWFKNSSKQCIYTGKGLLMVKVCIDSINDKTISIK